MGRHAQNDVVLDVADGDLTVSRWHAAVFHAGDGSYRLRDLSSSSGTRVHGRPCHSVELSDGTAFEIGPFTLVFFAAARAVSAKPSTTDAYDLRADPLAQGALPRQIVVRATVEPTSVHSIVQRLAGTLEPDRFLAALLHEVQRFARPSYAIAARIDASGGLDVRAELAADEGRQRAPSTAPSLALIQRVVTQKCALAAAPDSGALRGLSPSIDAYGITAAICAPVLSGGRVEAVVYTDWRGPARLPSETEFQDIARLIHDSTHAYQGTLRIQQLEQRAERLEATRRAATQILGVSRATRELLFVVERCAKADVDVLVLGETGTGKELVARRVHELSVRGRGPFVTVDANTVPESLFEGELFGHKKGAFTHAIGDQAGKVEAAEGGTLFIDEVGDLPLELQGKLLRLLQERTFRRLGENVERHANVRVIAATNKDLRALVAEGRFRSDFVHRLGTPIHTTPLRERLEDLPLISYGVLDLLVARHGAGAVSIAREVLDAFGRYEWPGNVRELAAVLRNALVFGDGLRVVPADLRCNPEVLGANGDGLQSLEDVEREHIARVLTATKGNQRRAAEVLGITENTIKEKMTRYGLQREQFRSDTLKRDNVKRVRPR
jgi:transcriptional regulator with GAF, ATPase, and Fis domain